jgi:hypothetical protein
MLTPNVSPDADLPERRRYAEALGSYLAERAEAELEGAEPLQVDGLRHAVHEVELVNENWRFRLFQRIGMLESTARDGRVSADLHHLRVGDVECLTAPGEVAPELGQRMRGTMRRPHRLVLGLCDDELGYVLEPGMFDDREYRYEQTMSLGRGTAEALMDTYRRLVSEDRR